MFQARYYKDFAPTERAWPPTNVQWTGVPARHWSLAIYSFVFRDSAPKARYQDSLGQAKAGFDP